MAGVRTPTGSRANTFACAPTIADRLEARENNFDLLRLVAATLVLIAHCWDLSGRGFLRLANDTFGGTGVGIFFAISGFLVARSWSLDPRASAFALKRFLRLWPALAVFVLVTAVVLGPVVSDRSFGAYWSPQTTDYLVSNAILHTRIHLPGVFPDNPAPTMIAGPLWTLPVEVKAYVMLLVLGLLGILRRPLMLVALFLGLVLVLVRAPDYHDSVLGYWLEAPVQTHLMMTFLAGTLMYALRDRVRLDWRLALLAAIAFAFTSSLPGPLRPAVSSLALAYVVLVLAFRTPRSLKRLTEHGDVSYGVYLWGYPVQQVVIMAAGGHMAPGVIFVIAAPLTYLAALASWRFVEAPALALKRRLPLFRVRAPQPNAA